MWMVCNAGILVNVLYVGVYARALGAICPDTCVRMYVRMYIHTYHRNTYIRTYVCVHNGMYGHFMALTGLIVIEQCIYWAGIPSGPGILCDVLFSFHSCGVQF